jgi:hypothetical protein
MLNARPADHQHEENVLTCQQGPSRCSISGALRARYALRLRPKGSILATGYFSYLLAETILLLQKDYLRIRPLINR